MKFKSQHYYQGRVNKMRAHKLFGYPKNINCFYDFFCYLINRSSQKILYWLVIISLQL